MDLPMEEERALVLGVWGRGIGVGCTGFSGGGGRERGRTRAPEERRVPYELMGYGEGLEGGSGAEGMDVFAGAEIGRAHV